MEAVTLTSPYTRRCSAHRHPQRRLRAAGPERSGIRRNLDAPLLSRWDSDDDLEEDPSPVPADHRKQPAVPL